MSKREKREIIPAIDALREWLSKDMVAGPLAFDLIPQAAPNRHINVYRVSTAEGTFFVKVYLDTPDVAEREVEYYQYFKQLPFVPNLKHYIFPGNSERRLIAYEFIEGDDLHKQFTAARQTSRYLPESVMLQAIDQMSAMRDTVQAYDSLIPTKTPWPLKSPIRRDFIPQDVEQEFLREYAEVFAQNKQALEQFPGYYFDRNPRNLMRDVNGVHQVDFGVIERSSPIFDLVKLLRNGTDIIFQEEVELMSVTDESTFIEQISTYPMATEEEFLRYTYRDYVEKSKPSTEATFDKFQLAYHFASVHSHFFYMTKYLRMLRDATGERKKLVTRCIYHIGLARKVLHELASQGQPVAHLEKWIDLFIKEASNQNEIR